jgi:hypothetical protein
MDIDEYLFKKPKDEYGERYEDHYLEIYRLYVEMADRISSRRRNTNSYFLAVNTAVIAVVAYLQMGVTSTNGNWYWLIGSAGMAVCYMWYRLVRSYKDLNSGKFKVIRKIEQNLPIAPYDAEWECLGRGEDKNLYLPFTRIEKFVPWIFFVLHLAVVLRSIPWCKLTVSS